MSTPPDTAPSPADGDLPALTLAGRDGASLVLRPERYEFDGVPGDSPARLWDANWLVVAGSARTADGRTWSFEDACLTTWEGRDLAQWLHAAAAGDVPVEADPQQLLGWDDSETTRTSGLVEFTEPNLAFSVAAHSADAVMVRAHLSLECRPPHGTGSDAAIGHFTIPLTLTPADLAAAADRWSAALEPFPQR